jgi:hypothetical protein
MNMCLEAAEPCTRMGATKQPSCWNAAAISILKREKREIPRDRRYHGSRTKERAVVREKSLRKEAVVVSSEGLALFVVGGNHKISREAGAKLGRGVVRPRLVGAWLGRGWGRIHAPHCEAGPTGNLHPIFPQTIQRSYPSSYVRIIYFSLA